MCIIPQKLFLHKTSQKPNDWQHPATWLMIAIFSIKPRAGTAILPSLSQFSTKHTEPVFRFLSSADLLEFLCPVSAESFWRCTVPTKAPHTCAPCRTQKRTICPHEFARPQIARLPARGSVSITSCRPSAWRIPSLTLLYSIELCAYSSFMSSAELVFYAQQEIWGGNLNDSGSHCGYCHGAAMAWVESRFVWPIRRAAARFVFHVVITCAHNCANGGAGQSPTGGADLSAFLVCDCDC